MVHSGSVGVVSGTAPMEIGLVVLVVLALGFLLLLHIRSSSRERLNEEKAVYFEGGTAHGGTGGSDSVPHASSRRLANSARVSDRTPMAPTFSAHPRTTRRHRRHVPQVPVAPPMQPRMRAPMMVPSLTTVAPPLPHVHPQAPLTARLAVPSVLSPGTPPHGLPMLPPLPLTPGQG